MKVGILTFQQSHFSFVQRHNYGAILQAYALKETIKTIKGVKTVSILDYKPSIDFNPKNTRYFYRIHEGKTFFIKLKIFVLLVLMFPKIYLRRLGFKSFIKRNLDLSEKKYRSFTSNFDYDSYILGSDQIWNKSILDGFDPIFFGSFKTKPYAKKIAYAVSGGIKNIENKDKEFYEAKLKDLNHISVRENSYEKLLQPFCTQKIETVLDPTLLASPEIFNKIIKSPKNKEKYILIYLLGGIDSQIEKITLEIAAILDLKVTIITFQSDEWICRKNIIQTASPEKFLGLFKHADLVLTNSFHGTTFSIIFNKTFFSLLSGTAKDERIINLLEKLALKNQTVKDFNEVKRKLGHKINWDKSKQLLEIERRRSFEFLNNALTD